MPVAVKPASDRALLRVTAESVRLVLRHLLSGAVSQRTLTHQLQRLDKALGREWHDIATGGQIHDIGKQKGSR